jgi:hypothetical protein
VDEVQLEPRVAAVLEGVVVDGATRLRILRYAQPFALAGPSELERSFAAAAPGGAVVGGRLRLLPFEDGAVAVQTFYADSGTMRGVVAGWRGAIGVGGTMREALRGIGPTPKPSGATVPAVSLEAAREWFAQLDRARASGDWEAFGDAWAGLRAALGLGGTSPSGRVDPPVARD